MIKQTVWVLLAGLAVLLGLVGCASPQPSQESMQLDGAPRALHAIAGYMVPEGDRDTTALSSGDLTEISPVWYQPTDGGQLVFASQEAKQSVPDVEADASAHHAALVPSISNYRNGIWDGSLIHRLITDTQLRQTHIAAIVSLVTSHHWAGIDLDYESLATRDRNAYSASIHDLATALHHVQKRLTITVHAKTAEPGDWSGARAQDWRALGESADEVRVMAYDYSTESSPPGPIAPLPWVEKVLRLAISEVPRDKIMLGVATYGYDWIDGGGSSQPGQDMQWTDAQALAQDHGTSLQWDATSQSPWFAYTDSQGQRHTVWYEDARSLQAKIDLALRDDVHSIVIWRLGGEDPVIWKQLTVAK